MLQWIKNRLSILAAAGTLAIMLLVSVQCFAADAFMSVEQIKPGMQGIAKTVIAGDKIEEFNVEIIDILRNQGPSGDLIAVKVSGDVINRTNGIVQGMSGSPVYVEGKLVGAIAYGWGLTDHCLALVTPIKDMLKLWEVKAAVHPSLLPASGTEKAVRLGTPLIANGFGEQAMMLLTTKLKDFGMVPYGVGTTTAKNAASKVQLQPGSSVAAELVRGDASLAGIGTVTYVDGNKMLAFGHQFRKTGVANYFMSGANIVTVVSSLDNGFKLGTVGEPIGVITQDRGAGLAGDMSRFPSIIPVRVTVKDNDLGRQKNGSVQIVNDQALSPVLTAASVLSVAEKTVDRVGSGTAKVSFEITTRELDNPVKRENMYFSPANSLDNITTELYEAVDLIINNKYKAVDIMDININIVVDDKQLSALIIEAKLQKEQVKPGEKVDIIVKLLPYRSAEIIRTISYTVPKDLQPGQFNLAVRGGSFVAAPKNNGKKAGADKEGLRQLFGKQKTQSLGEQLKSFMYRDRNNDLIVDLAEDEEETDNSAAVSQNNNKPKAPKKSADKNTVVKGAAKPNNPADKTEAAEAGKSRTSTDYIIEGMVPVTINVIK